MQLIDQYQRKIDYLRVSVTDHCNLHCIYCRPTKKAEFLPRKDMLSFEEIERIVQAAVKAGISKVRLTGGEPLLRRNIVDLVGRLAKIKGIDDLCLTTSGWHLSELAQPLKKAGLMRVNLSLDSLNPERYRKITGGGDLNEVRRGIEALQKAGLEPLKINMVVMRNINEAETLDFVKLALENPWQVRFIELRPKNPLYGQAYLPIGEVWQRINEQIPLQAVQTPASITARIYTFDGAKGSLGFIGEAEETLCAACNRLRLNAAGMLYPCLFSSQPLDLKRLLRIQAGDEELLSFFKQAVVQKPAHMPKIIAGKNTPMYKIGG